MQLSRVSSCHGSGRLCPYHQSVKTDSVFPSLLVTAVIAIRGKRRRKEALVTALTGLLTGVLWREEIRHPQHPAFRLCVVQADLDKNTAICHTRRWLEQWGACSFDIKKYLATHLLITSELLLKAKAINQVNYVLVPPLRSAESKSCGTRWGHNGISTQPWHSEWH